MSRSHSGDVYKLVEKFKPPGVVTPAGGSGFKVALFIILERPGMRWRIRSCQMWEVAVGHEDVYLHSSLIKKVNELQPKWHPTQMTYNPNCIQSKLISDPNETQTKQHPIQMRKIPHNPSSVGSLCWCSHTEQSRRENDWHRWERTQLWPWMGGQVSIQHPKPMQHCNTFEIELPWICAQARRRDHRSEIRPARLCACHALGC